MSLVRTIGEIEGRCKFLLNLPIRNIAQNQSFVQKGIGVKYMDCLYRCPTIYCYILLYLAVLTLYILLFNNLYYFFNKLS